MKKQKNSSGVVNTVESIRTTISIIERHYDNFSGKVGWEFCYGLAQYIVQIEKQSFTKPYIEVLHRQGSVISDMAIMESWIRLLPFKQMVLDPDSVSPYMDLDKDLPGEFQMPNPFTCFELKELKKNDSYDLSSFEIQDLKRDVKNFHQYLITELQSSLINIPLGNIAIESIKFRERRPRDAELLFIINNNDIRTVLNKGAWSTFYLAVQDKLVRCPSKTKAKSTQSYINGHHGNAIYKNNAANGMHTYNKTRLLHLRDEDCTLRPSSSVLFEVLSYKQWEDLIRDRHS